MYGFSSPSESKRNEWSDLFHFFPNLNNFTRSALYREKRELETAFLIVVLTNMKKVRMKQSIAMRVSVKTFHTKSDSNVQIYGVLEKKAE